MFDFSLALNAGDRDIELVSSRFQGDSADVILPDAIKTSCLCMKDWHLNVSNSVDQLSIDNDGNPSINGWEVRLYSVKVEGAMDYVRDFTIKPFWSDTRSDTSSWIKLGMVSMTFVA